MISLALLPLDPRGVLFHIPGSLRPSLKDPRHYPQETGIQASPTEDILRAHLCTRVYTLVYTRVYSSLLGRRYTLGISTPRTRIFLSSAYAPPRTCPRTIVISCVSPACLPISARRAESVGYEGGRSPSSPKQDEGTIGSGGRPSPRGERGAFYLKSRTFVDKGMTTQ